MNNLKDSVLCTGFTGLLQLPCRLKNSNTADLIGLSSSMINGLVHELFGKLLNIFAHTNRGENRLAQVRNSMHNKMNKITLFMHT